MNKKDPNTWNQSTGLARAILHDRTERRKWLFYLILVPLAMMALGLWVIDGWVWGSPWRVLFWWGGCGLMTAVALLFALYEVLAVLREERGRLTNKDE